MEMTIPTWRQLIISSYNRQPTVVVNTESDGIYRTRETAMDSGLHSLDMLEYVRTAASTVVRGVI
jgi:hypothetical protein